MIESRAFTARVSNSLLVLSQIWTPELHCRLDLALGTGKVEGMVGTAAGVVEQEASIAEPVARTIAAAAATAAEIAEAVAVGPALVRLAVAG